MSKKKVINKGYTLTVTSWENDGDNYNTLSVTVDSKERALALQGLVKLSDFSTSHTERGLGNACEWESYHEDLVKDYLINNPVIMPKSWTPINFEDEDDWKDAYNELTYDLLGSSEWYISRVHESSYITYSPEDIYVEEIKG